MSAGQFPVTSRTRLHRVSQRGHYDRATVYAILDETLIGHVAVVHEGRPAAIPTLIARDGESLLLHGAPANRTFRALADGAEACVSVALIDGLVLARSAFHHSINYRSVVLYGQAEEVVDPGEKWAALERFTEKLVPGRLPSLRPMTGAEVRATLVLRMPIAEASAKVRSGGPADDEADYALPVWAGVLPLHTAASAPQPDERNHEGVELPAHVRQLGRLFEARGGLS